MTSQLEKDWKEKLFVAKLSNKVNISDFSCYKEFAEFLVELEVAEYPIDSWDDYSIELCEESIFFRKVIDIYDGNSLLYFPHKHTSTAKSSWVPFYFSE